MSAASKRLKRLFRYRNGQLYKEVNSKQLQVIDIGQREELLKQLHNDGGHPGPKKLQDLLLRLYWWPSCLDDCDTWVKSCASCQRFQQPTVHEDLRPLISDCPMQLIAVDCIGPLTADSKGNRYIVSMEQFSIHGMLNCSP